MGLPASLIPGIVFRESAIGASVDIAFNYHQVIRLDEQLGLGQGGQQAWQISSGVNDPLGALLLEVANKRLQFFGHGRLRQVIVDGPVKVG